jgi:hypothetical protein
MVDISPRAPIRQRPRDLAGTGSISRNRGEARGSSDLIRTSLSNVLEHFSTSRLEPRGQRGIPLTGLAPADVPWPFAPKQAVSRGACHSCTCQANPHTAAPPNFLPASWLAGSALLCSSPSPDPGTAPVQRRWTTANSRTVCGTYPLSKEQRHPEILVPPF